MLSSLRQIYPPLVSLFLFCHVRIDGYRMSGSNFSREFCKSSQNDFFIEELWTISSGISSNPQISTQVCKDFWFLWSTKTKLVGLFYEKCYLLSKKSYFMRTFCLKWKSKRPYYNYLLIFSLFWTFSLLLTLKQDIWELDSSQFSI